MKLRIADESLDCENLLPPASPDGSGIGVNYVDAYLKPLNVELADGRKLALKRKGLKILLSITHAEGEAKGEAIIRRVDHGPDPRAMLRHALERAASAAGVRFVVEDGAIWIDSGEAEGAS